MYIRSEFLSTADIELIHQTSTQLLANVGVEFPDDEAIAVFEKHGFKTDGHRVYFSEEQVMSAVETIPAQFTLHARNPDRNVIVGDGVPVFVPAYGAPFLVDYEVGKRVPTVEDYENLIRLAHALPDWAFYAALGAATAAAFSFASTEYEPFIYFQF